MTNKQLLALSVAKRIRELRLKVTFKPNSIELEPAGDVPCQLLIDLAHCTAETVKLLEQNGTLESAACEAAK